MLFRSVSGPRLTGEIRTAIMRDDDLAEGGVGGLKMSRMLVRASRPDVNALQSPLSASSISRPAPKWSLGQSRRGLKPLRANTDSSLDRHEVSQVDKKLLTSPPPSEMSDRQQARNALDYCNDADVQMARQRILSLSTVDNLQELIRAHNDSVSRAKYALEEFDAADDDTSSDGDFDSKARVDKPTRTASSSVASHKKQGRLSAEYDDDVQAYRHSQEHANGSRVEDGDGEDRKSVV